MSEATWPCSFGLDTLGAAPCRGIGTTSSRRILTVLPSSSSPASNAMRASETDENARPEPLPFSTSEVRW